MSPVIRIPDGLYKRLQGLATPFTDTPATVIERLLDEHEKRKVAQEESMIAAHSGIGMHLQATGYLLLAQQQWLDFHSTHSIGQSGYYCRGVGAPMNNVAPGGVIFCVQTGEVPHRVHLCGYFDGWERRTISEAWKLYRQRLGAQTEDEWRALIGSISSISETGEVLLIRLNNIRVPTKPVNLAPLRITLKPGSVKGRSLLPDEVSRLLNAL
jgi:hypothetical protein